MAVAHGLVKLAADAHSAAKDAQAERAKAMDAIIDLLFERAEMRQLLSEAMPHLPVRLAERVDAALAR